MTKFSDMPIGSLSGWLAWAHSHDWGANEFPAWFDDMTGELVTYCWVQESDGTEFIEEARHMTPRDLKAWAGY